MADGWSGARAAAAVAALLVAASFGLDVISRIDGPDTEVPSQPSTTGATTTAPAGSSTTTIAATGPCGPANILAALGDTGRATSAYQAVLQANPTSECAAAGLLALNSVVTPPKPDPCAVGKALREAGADDEAKKVLAEAVKQEGDCAAEELERVTAPSLAERATSFVSDVGSFLALIALLAVALFVLATPFRDKRWRTLQRLRKPTLVFDPFKEPSVDPKPASAVTALVAAAYHEVDDGYGWSSPGLVDSHLELSGVLDLDKVLPQFGVAAGILKVAERLSGAERLTVSGQLHPAGSKGPGLTIRLTDRHGVVDVDTARLPALPAGQEATEESFGDLAVFAAAWTRHQAGRCLHEEPPTLTTRNSVSYAWLVTGQVAAARGDHPAALARYRMAVEADPDHLRALIQRALALTDTDADYELASAALIQVIDVIEAVI